MTKFSIIINSHNQNNYLERCILSILNQDTNEDFEIIVQDFEIRGQLRVCVRQGTVS